MIYRMKDKNRGEVKIPSKGMVSQTLVLLQNLKPFMTYRNIHKEGRLSPICFGWNETGRFNTNFAHSTLLEKFWQISLCVTDDAIVQSSKFSQIL